MKYIDMRNTNFFTERRKDKICFKNTLCTKSDNNALIRI